MANIIGENIRKMRMGKNITRVKLAEMTEGKVSKNALYYIEKGITFPKYDTLEVIAKALDVSIYELTGKDVSRNELISRLMSRLDSIELKLNKLIDKEVKSNE